MNDLSFGEYEALVKKAFRGAGYSWGLAEDASFAARRLGEFVPDSAELIVQLLDLIDGLELRSLMPDSHGPFACPICVGVSLADRAGSAVSPVVVPAVVVPALIAPLARFRSFDGVVVEWDGGRCEASPSALVLTGEQPSHAVDVTVTASSSSFRVVPSSRVSVDPGPFAALGRFAHRTYAPATEASRRAAGPAD